MQFFHSLQCLTSSYEQFMGNCTGSNIEKGDLNLQSAGHKFNSNNMNNNQLCQSDVTVTSPESENGEISLKMNLLSRTFPCKIPVLKDSLTCNYQPNSSKGSYKSVLFNGSLSSRIPVTNTNVECRKSVPSLYKEDDLSQKLLYESGFVSDLSVTTSLYSQTNDEIKVAEIVNYDTVDVAMARHRKIKNQPLNIVTNNYIEVNAKEVSKDDLITNKIIPHEVQPSKPFYTSTKSVSICNVDRQLRRPQSLSTDSELAINKSLLKRITLGSDLTSPMMTLHEDSSVMQEVSSLKLMLHKLKRYLIQEEDEGMSGAMNERLFRLPYSPIIEMNTMSREELEREYHCLYERYATLERLLVSREQLIAKLESEKILSDKEMRPDLCDDSDTRCEGSTLNKACYQWSNLKLPQEHI